MESAPNGAKDDTEEATLTTEEAATQGVADALNISDVSKDVLMEGVHQAEFPLDERTKTQSPMEPEDLSADTAIVPSVMNFDLLAKGVHRPESTELGGEDLGIGEADMRVESMSTVVSHERGNSDIQLEGTHRAEPPAEGQETREISGERSLEEKEERGNAEILVEGKHGTESPEESDNLLGQRESKEIISAESPPENKEERGNAEILVEGKHRTESPEESDNLLGQQESKEIISAESPPENKERGNADILVEGKHRTESPEESDNLLGQQESKEIISAESPPENKEERGNADILVEGKHKTESPEEESDNLLLQQETREIISAESPPENKMEEKTDILVEGNHKTESPEESDNLLPQQETNKISPPENKEDKDSIIPEARVNTDILVEGNHKTESPEKEEVDESQKKEETEAEIPEKKILLEGVHGAEEADKKASSKAPAKAKSKTPEPKTPAKTPEPKTPESKASESKTPEQPPEVEVATPKIVEAVESETAAKNESLVVDPAEGDVTSKSQVAINTAASKVLEALANAATSMEGNLELCGDDSSRQLLEEKKHALLVQMDNMRSLLTEPTHRIDKPAGPLNSWVESHRIDNPELRDMVQSLDELPYIRQGMDRADSVMSSRPSCESPRTLAHSDSQCSHATNLTDAVLNLQRMRRQVDCANEGRNISEGLALESWFSVEEAERDIPELRRVRRQIRYLFGASFPNQLMGSDDSSDCGRSRQDVPTLPPVRQKADSSASDTRSVNDTWSSSGLSSYTSEAITEISPPKDKKERKHHRHRHYKQEERRSRSKKEEDLKHSSWAEDIDKYAANHTWSGEKGRKERRGRWEQPRQKSTPADIVRRARERANEVLRTGH